MRDSPQRVARQNARQDAQGLPSDVVALTFARRDRVDADLHVVLAPPLSWGEVQKGTVLRPFGQVSVPVVCWNTLLAIEDEKRLTARRLVRQVEPVAQRAEQFVTA